MARRRRSSGFSPAPIKVSVYDARLGESISFTVYGSMAERIAQAAHQALSARWSTTSLTDRRHKRRL